MRALTNGIELEYEVFGNSAHPVLLLIAGMGSQMITWDEQFINLFVEGGLRVVIFDNRDVGRSTYFDEFGKPDLKKAMSGEAPYLLSDMAADVAGLIDFVGVDAAHVFGISLGGMVAQSLAIEYPSKVLSVTSVMSTTGSPAVGQASQEAAAMLTQTAPPERSEYLEAIWKRFQVTGWSPKFPVDERYVKDRAEAAYDRSYHPGGNARQLAAVLASGDRTKQLRSVNAPTLAIHGSEDKLIDVSGAEATAAAIPNAELMVIEGMGHHLPRQVWPIVVEATLKNTVRG